MPNKTVVLFLKGGLPNAPGLLRKLVTGKDGVSRNQWVRGAERLTIMNEAQSAHSGGKSKLTESERQYKEVEARYRGTPQWMKAPNGQPTKLTEKQWVQVRTPNFKNWFGDWESLAAELKLSGIPPIDIEVDHTKDFAWHKSQGLTQYTMLRGLAHGAPMPAMGVDVEFGDSGEGKSTSGTGDVRKFAVIKHLPELFANAVYVGSAAAKDIKREPNTKAYHRLVSKARMDGVTFDIALLVREDNNGHYHYNHTLFKESGPGALWAVESEKTRSDTAYIGPDDFNLYKERPLVNPDDVSKVIDSNGEPLVVYHGTPNDFDAFDTDNGAYFIPKKQVAEKYAGRDGRVIDAFISAPKVAKHADLTRIGASISGEKNNKIYFQKMRDEGFQLFAPMGMTGEVIALTPESIKSATDNNGDFSPMQTNFTKALGNIRVLFFKSQIAAYTDKNGRFVAAHYDKRTKKGEVKQATENLTADMFADAPSPEPKKADKKADWTDPDIFGEASKPGKKQADDDFPESFLPKRSTNITPQVLSERVADSIISAAADSIATLRRVDVGRVMDETPVHYKLSMARHIKEHRRDLSDEVDSVMAEDSPAPVKAKKLPYASKEDLNHLFGKSLSSFDVFLKSHVKQFTRKDGSIVKEHDDKRQKKVQAAPVARQPAQDEQGNGNAPAKAEESGYGHHNMQEGDSIGFKAGDFAGKGKIKSVGQDGATVTDQSGRDHQVHWHEVTGRGGEPEAKEVKPDTPEREAQKGDADGKVIGKIDGNTARRANADETSRALFNTSETDQLPKKALQSEKFDSWDKISAGATEALDQFKGMLGEVAKSLDLETGKIPATYDFAQAEENAKNKADGKPAVKLNEEKYMTPKQWDNVRGFLFIGPLKKKDRAEAKVKADYTNKKTGEQDWTQLKDMVRATIAVPSVTQIPKVLAEMKKAGIELAQQPKNNLTGEGLHGSGYRDINLIVKMPNGMLAELQIHCKPMTHAKEHGHEHYAANAAIERQYDSEDEDHKTWSEEHKKTHAENASKMKAIYDKAWDKAIGGGDDEKPTETLHKSLNKPIMILLKRRAK